MDHADRLALLEGIGFSSIEGLVYLALLAESPQTGYRLSTDLGKSRSNTYQALASLESRNAIIRLEGRRHGEYIPVPIQELMEAREREFASRKATIVEALKDVGPVRKQDYTYRITGTEELFEKALAMIGGARSTILVDTDAGPLGRLHEALEERARSGLKVLVETPEPSRLAVYEHIRLETLTPKDRDWEADWLCLGVDGERFLISLVDRKSGDLIHAIWSGDAYISPWIFNGMLHEMAFRFIMRLLTEGLGRDAILESVARFTGSYFQPSPGFIRLGEALAERLDRGDAEPSV